MGRKRNDENATDASMKRREIVILWGLIFMVFYLYSYQAATVIRWVPTPRSIPDHADEARQIPEALFWSVGKFYHALWVLSIPTVGISQRILPLEPYYSDLIYIPFLNAFQWFAYGCAFGMWRYKMRIRRTPALK